TRPPTSLGTGGQSEHRGRTSRAAARRHPRSRPAAASWRWDRPAPRVPGRTPPPQPPRGWARPRAGVTGSSARAATPQRQDLSVQVQATKRRSRSGPTPHGLRRDGAGTVRGERDVPAMDHGLVVLVKRNDIALFGNVAIHRLVPGDALCLVLFHEQRRDALLHVLR